MKHFIFKEDGKLYYVSKLPEQPNYCSAWIADDRYCHACYINAPGSCSESEKKYKQSIDDAIEVENQDKVREEIENALYEGDTSLVKTEVGKIYSLECEVEVKKWSCNRYKEANETECPHSMVEFPDCCGINKKVARVIFQESESVEETHRDSDTKLLEEIDELLSSLENTAHGEESKRITEMRYRIQNELGKNNQFL